MPARRWALYDGSSSSCRRPSSPCSGDWLRDWYGFAIGRIGGPRGSAELRALLPLADDAARPSLIVALRETQHAAAVGGTGPPGRRDGARPAVVLRYILKIRPARDRTGFTIAPVGAPLLIRLEQATSGP